LSKKHPLTANTYSNIAEVYFNQESYDAAIEWYRKALAIREKVFGKEHSKVANTCSNIAKAQNMQVIMVKP